MAGNAFTLTGATNTSTPTGSTVNIGKRTRKRKERQQHSHHEIMPSSDHFLTLSPSSANMGMFLFSNESFFLLND